MVVDYRLDYDENHAVCARQVDEPDGRLVEELSRRHKVAVDEEEQPEEEAHVEGQGKGKRGEEVVTKAIAASTCTRKGDVRVADELRDEGDEEVRELNELKGRKNRQFFTF